MKSFPAIGTPWGGYGAGMDGGAIIGFDVASVEAWLARELPALAGPLRWHRLTGGHSNLTYRIAAPSGTEAVIRRPPLGELLPKAHDMAREHRVLSALWPTPVPVPQPLALCEDTAVTGAPFYVMAPVDGRTTYTRDDLESWVPEEDRAGLARSLVAVLAELHSLRPADVGLERLGRPDGYVARQLERWYGSFLASPGEPGLDSTMAPIHDRLARSLPAQQAVSIVHGDFGLHNMIVTPQGDVAAVIDWEISTLGDPLADLAYLLNSWARPGDPVLPDARSPSLAPGFPERGELASLYADRTGLDLDPLGVYVLFNQFKSVCILQGVYARYVLGQKEIDEADLRDLRTRLLATVERLRRTDAALAR